MLNSLISILQSPISRLLLCGLRISLEEISDLLLQGIVKIRCRHKYLYRLEDGPHLQSRAPLVLENVEADSPKLVYVWVEYFSTEENFWWHHWVLICEENL